MLHGLFCSCGEQGLPSSWASHCGGFSCCGAQALGHVGFSCSSQALEHRLNSCGTQALVLCGMWDLPDPGIKPVSPALAGRFFTTEPPGKPPGTWVLINEEARNHGSAQKTHRAWKSSFLRAGSGQWGGSRSCSLLWPPDSGCPAMPGPSSPHMGSPALCFCPGSPAVLSIHP